MFVGWARPGGVPRAQSVSPATLEHLAVQLSQQLKPSVVGIFPRNDSFISFQERKVEARYMLDCIVESQPTTVKLSLGQTFAGVADCRSPGFEHAHRAAGDQAQGTKH